MILNNNIIRTINRQSFKVYLQRSSRFCSTISYPELDLDYFCNPNNFEEIVQNVSKRKGVGDIKLINEIKSKLDSLSNRPTDYKQLQKQFYDELLKLPNKTHPAVKDLLDEPHIVKYIGTERTFHSKPLEFHEIVKRLNLLRTDQLGNLAGSRSYYVLGEMAELEHALIQYTVNNLLHRGFQLISVPDILPRNIIESCGLNTRGTRTQVYSLDPKMYGPDLCLSGTSEMALGGYFTNQIVSEEDLPIKIAAVSRCYRAEVSSIAEEKGIYRVHEFTKVEMFALSTPEKSDDVLEYFRAIEEENFSDLGLYLRVLDMPPHELGAPAYRKYDVEAWLPGRNIFGEVSSCSNCTDYQSRRLNIKFKSKDTLKHVHTLNGTACAIPRMLIAITETFQNEKGFIEVPEVLKKFMRNKKSFSRQKKIPELKLIKHKK